MTTTAARPPATGEAAPPPEDLLADVPRMMAEHDAGHRAEIAALLEFLRTAGD